MFKWLQSFFFIILDFTETIVTSFIIFIFFYLFLFQPHQVKGNSMLPNFVNGENLLTNKIIYRFREPYRGDVIVFKSPQNPKIDYIKRIIALPGEKIKLENGHFYINDKLLDESSYLPPNTYTQGGHFINEGKSIDIPVNYYFVCGDNRPHSSDSREWGLIHKKDIIGKAWLRYWPPSKFGLLPTIAW